MTEKEKVSKTIKAVLDTETLDTIPTSVLLSAGFVIYDESKLDSFDSLLESGENVVFDIQPQLDTGRSVSASTLSFWMDQGRSAKDKLFKGKSTPDHLIGMIESVTRKFFNIPDSEEIEYDNQGRIKLLKDVKIQVRGQDFDIPLVNNFLMQYGFNTPFNYSKSRDLRTIYDENNFDYHAYEKLNKPKNFIKHNSLHDSAFDAFMLQRMRNLPEDFSKIDLESK